MMTNLLTFNHRVLYAHRSSHPELFCQKGVLNKNFAKFTGKYLYQSQKRSYDLNQYL